MNASLILFLVMAILYVVICFWHMSRPPGWYRSWKDVPADHWSRHKGNGRYDRRGL